MVFVYGNAFSKEDSAFSLVREIRKREPRVCLLSALSDDEAGLSVIDTMISETILFDPATVYLRSCCLQSAAACIALF